MAEALLLVAHGSRRESSNDEIRVLTRQLAARLEIGLVDCAFLELAQPDIVSGGHDLVARGARNVTVLPYFLVAGRHVVTDVPAEIERLRQAHPDVSFRIADYLGSNDAMVDLILASLSK